MHSMVIGFGLLFTLAAIYLTWCITKVIRRVGVVRFGKATSVLAFSVVASVARLFVPTKKESSCANFSVRDLGFETDSFNDYYAPGHHYNLATGNYDDGMDPNGIYYNFDD
jgi:hypothetical protein